MEEVAEKVKINLIALDETEYYNIAEEDRPHIKKILGVYMYQPDVRTHCCELTPSYWLEPLYTTIVFADHVYGEGPDDSIEALLILQDLIDSLDNKYAHEPMEGCYVHCRVIQARPFNSEHIEGGEFESEEEAREYYQGNCPV